MKVRFSSGANADVRRILEYYKREAGSEIARDFYEELDATIERMKLWPRAFPFVRYELRRAVLKKFPFQIIYKIEQLDCLAIYAIRHHRQRPDFGLSR